MGVGLGLGLRLGFGFGFGLGLELGLGEGEVLTSSNSRPLLSSTVSTSPARKKAGSRPLEASERTWLGLGLG